MIKKENVFSGAQFVYDLTDSSMFVNIHSIDKRYPGKTEVSFSSVEYPSGVTKFENATISMTRLVQTLNALKARARFPLSVVSNQERNAGQIVGTMYISVHPDNDSEENRKVADLALRMFCKSGHISHSGLVWDIEPTEAREESNPLFRYMYG